MPLKAIHLKLLRDLWRLRVPILAIALVMAAGVASLVMAFSTNSSLRRAREEYYDDRRFADVFAGLKRAPLGLRNRLAQIPGVAAVQTRVVFDVNLSIPGVEQPGTARLVSLPDAGEPTLNAIHVRRGRLPEVGSSREVVVLEAFADANGLEPGDTLGAVINGKWQVLSVVGVGLSPEFVYFVRPGEILPDNRRSAVMWMRESGLSRALDMDGAFNDVAVRLDESANAQDVIFRIDALLDRYGGFGAHDRTEHISDRYLRDEFNQLSVMGTLTPSIFLGVAAFLVNVVLGRLVRTQREQIATLKAMGYTNTDLALHVLMMSAVIAVVATAAGTLLGWYLGADLTRFYTANFRFPELRFRVEPVAVIAGGCIAIIAAGVGSVSALGWILRLSPAEAMRPESPREFRPTLIERLGISGLPVRWRLVLRAIESHPWRSSLAATGVAMSAAVLVLSNFALDSIEFMIDREYFASQRYDSAVALTEPTHDSAVGSLRGMAAGTAFLQVEPYRAVGARISHAQRSRRVAIIGVEPDSSLHRLLNKNAARVEPPREGLLLSESLADLLGVAPGKTVDVQVLEGQRRRLRLPVSGVFSGYMGLGAYMRRDTLNRVLGEGPVMSGAYLREDPAAAAEAYQLLKLTPRVAATTGKRGALEAFRATLAENITRITIVHVLFAGVIAFGVVFNTARVALAERARDFATLRVLGFQRGEITAMLLGEVALLVAVGIPVGLVIGRWIAWAMVLAMQTESYVFPLIISPATYAFSAVVTVAAAMVSALVIRRGVNRLDLMATLKNVG